MTAHDPAKAAAILEAVLEQVVSGLLTSPTGLVRRIEGAVIALTELAEASASDQMGEVAGRAVDD